MAASTRPRPPVAANVVRIIPRRYSAVTNSTLTAIRAITPNSTPIRLICTTSSSCCRGPIEPEPLSVYSAPATIVAPPPRSFGRSGMATSSPTRTPGAAPSTVTLSNVAVPEVPRSPTDVLPALRSTLTVGGELTNSPISAVAGRSTRTVPTSRHATPSADEDAVTRLPARVSRSHVGAAPAPPPSSVV